MLHATKSYTEIIPVPIEAICILGLATRVAAAVSHAYTVG
jgi:hypothetical protein